MANGLLTDWGGGTLQLVPYGDSNMTMISGTSRKVRLAAFAFAGVCSFALAACGGGAAADDKIDDELLSDAKDPAMTGALEDQILVDPDLTSQNDRNSALTAGGPPNGALPTDTGSVGSAQRAVADAQAALGEGRMMSAPEPTRVAAEDCTTCADGGGATLGARAREQYSGRGKGTCDDRLTYDMGWANRMPPEFPIYPRANVREAAGVEAGLCDIRVVTFRTTASLKNVADFYYTKARRSGFDAEYQLRGDDYVLGGTRDVDDGAYVVFMRPQSNGGTEVDIVASNGR